jgi:hypothetical protein
LGYKNGGEGGIRTHGGRKPTTVFETAPIDHSGTSPRLGVVTGGWIAGLVAIRKGQSIARLALLTGSCSGPSLAIPQERATSVPTVFGKDHAMSMPRLALAALLAFALPAAAQTTTEPPAASVSIARLGEVMRLDDLFDVLREEGISYGAELEADMFPSGGGPGWARSISDIYDIPILRARFNQALRAGLAQDPETLAEITDFFTSDLGSRILTLEIEARRAFLDDAAEDAARVAADKRRASRDSRAQQIERFIASADLLEMNVAGALSGNLAFLNGMNETGVNGVRLPQEEVMEQVWGQEAQIRSDTESWLHAYLGLAYAPLTDQELDAYIAFWETPAGQRLNAVLFIAFDQVFGGVSHQLGQAAGQAMLGQDI